MFVIGLNQIRVLSWCLIPTHSRACISGGAAASDRFEHTIIVRRDCNYYYCAGQSYFSKGAMPQDVPRLQVTLLLFRFAFIITIYLLLALNLESRAIDKL